MAQCKEHHPHKAVGSKVTPIFYCILDVGHLPKHRCGDGHEWGSALHLPDESVDPILAREIVDSEYRPQNSFWVEGIVGKSHAEEIAGKTCVVVDAFQLTGTNLPDGITAILLPGRQRKLGESMEEYAKHCFVIRKGKN